MKRSLWALIVFSIIGFSVLMTRGVEVFDRTSLQAMNYNAHSSQHFDTDGNLLVPFDIAYPEAFWSDEVIYSDDIILIKKPLSFNGRLTPKMEEAGVADLTVAFDLKDSRWYEATIEEGRDIHESMWTLRSDRSILVADYNYLQQAADIDYSQAFDLSDLSDPMASSQWYLEGFGIEEAWSWMEDNDLPKGGSQNVIVAVIDTGVDYTHPDLIGNMWVNPNETANSRDTNSNGFIDDIHGVNVVGTHSRDWNGDPMDDHGHGTHVAGIIAASNNNTGIIGIAHNVQIMAIKAGMSSGFFHQSSIARGILYAYENGADVINMSFGGGASSIAVQDALQVAYTRSVLVAAAGNSGFPNEPTRFFPGVPSYPAALSYVIGVMSVDDKGVESGFSNWDPYEFNSVEYEVYAPGQDMLSTLPNNQYIRWSGTSMAAPVVSAIAALVRSAYPDPDVYPNKFIMGQIVSTSENRAINFDPNLRVPRDPLAFIVNAHDALTKMPKPELHLFDYYIFDPSEISGNNGDGIVDAGEEIQVGLVLINRWGKSENTTVTLNANSPSGQATDKVTFTTDTVSFGDVGTYSTKDFLSRDGSIVTGVHTAAAFTVDSNAPNDYIVRINVTGTYENALDPTDDEVYTFNSSFFVTIRKGEILPNRISEDMTLTSDNYYIIPNSMIIEEEATVTVEAGTYIQFWSDDPSDAYADSAMTYLRVEGKLLVEGTIDEPVFMFPSGLRDRYRVEIFESGNGFVSINHANIVNPYLNISYLSHSHLSNNFYQSLWYRYLSNSTIMQTSNSGMIRVGFSEYNIFQNIGSNNIWNLTHFNGHFQNNVFSEVLGNFNGTYDNNLFLTNNASRFNVNLSGTANIAGTTGFDIHRIYYHEATGKTYLDIGLGTTIDNVLYARELAEHFGGYLAVFETQEEFDLIRQQMGSSPARIVGLEYQPTDKDEPFIWNNGAPYSLSASLPDLDSRIGRPLLTWTGNSFVGTYANTRSNPQRALIEIDGDIYASSLFTASSSVVLDTESQYQLTISTQPQTAPKDNLIYVSDDPTVVTVSSEGLIQPQREGKAFVYIYTADYQRQTLVEVNVVEKIPLIDLNISVDNPQLSAGESMPVNVQYLPAMTTEKYVTFESSNTTVASINSLGQIQGLSTGQTTITVRNQSGEIEKTLTINVVVPVSSIAFEESIYVTSKDADNDNFLPTILPVDATNQTLIWESSNPDVVEVVNGELVKHKNGVATLRASVENTDLHADLVISVSDEIIDSKIIKMRMMSNQYFALSDDGNIYYWGNGVLAPRLLPIPGDQPIDDFSFINSSVIFVLRAGSVSAYRISSFLTSGTLPNLVSNTFGNLSNLTQLESISTNTHFVLRDDGVVYGYGNNYYGALGDGTYTDRNSIVQLPVQNVVDIKAASYGLLILTENGDLFLTGSTLRFNRPEKIASDVVAIGSQNDGNMLYYKTNDEISYIQTWASSSNYILSYPLESPTQTIGFNGSNQAYIENGNIFIKGSSNQNGLLGIGSTSSSPQFTQMLNISNAEKLFVFSNNIFIQTSDYRFYGTGINNNSQLANFKDEPSYAPTRIHFGLTGNEGEFRITQTNVNDDLLISDAIEIIFNESLVANSAFSSIWLYDQENNPVAIAIEMHLNRLYIKPFSALNIGEDYRLVIPNNAVSTKFMIGNMSETINFTYVGSQVEIALLESNLAANDQISDPNLSLYYQFSYAKQGPNFDEISLTRSSQSQTIDISLTNHRLTFSGLVPFGDFTLIIPAGALIDNMGNQNSLIEVNFSVIETLRILSNTHPDNSERALVNAPIRITFNHLNESTDFANIQLKQGETIIPASVTIEGSDLVVTPDANLSEGTSYTLTIPEDAVEGNLNDPNDALSFTFKTYEPLALAFSNISHSPTNFNPSGSIRLQYNFAVEGPAFENITLCQGDECVVVQVTLEDTILSIQPEEDLAFDKIYTLVIPSGALIDELGISNTALTHTFRTFKPTERFYWNSTNVNAEFDAFRAEGLHSRFVNNAILNNFTETNLDLWLRFTAQNGSTDHSAGMASNYFGTDNMTIINKHFFDFDTVMALIDIVYNPESITIPEDTFPFITNIRVLDAQGNENYSYGNETVTFVVNFNRDMDTSVPLDFRFGSSLPYAEFRVMGDYVNPREWRGTYELRSFVDSGNQYFHIRNGHALDNPWLQLMPDVKRFTFVYDTTEVFAMIMSGTPETDGIALTWVQDDYETLAGYNVYRSTQENGMYQRINQSIILPETDPDKPNTFKDTNVVPGQVYYYNFTVVLTDFTESDTSGKIAVRALDTMAPNIHHTPVFHGFSNQNIIINATVTDNVGIDSVKLHYRIVDQSTWKTINMTRFNDRYSGIISANFIDLAGVEYYIEAFDGINTTTRGSAEQPFVIGIQAPIDQGSRGDVNGDGTINMVDALLVLRRINGQANLTPEQFTRADLNANGTLELAEVLSILRYASGLDGTLVIPE